MIPRSSFDFSQPPPSRTLRRSTILAVAVVVTAMVAGSGAVTPVVGASGDLYLVRGESKVWRSVGPALSVRFHTTGDNRSSVAAEAADLLPIFTEKADSAELKYLVLRAYRPIWHLGDLGIYRGWNFRYERSQDGWEASEYW